MMISSKRIGARWRVRITSLIVGGLLGFAQGVSADNSASMRSSTTIQRVALAPGAIFRDCADCPEMVVVPPGEFEMGFDGGEPERYEGPVRRVTISRGFAVGRYEITNAQYAQFVTETGYRGEQGCHMWDGKTAVFVATASWRDPGYGRPIRDEEPVACVSWDDAQAFIAWLSERAGRKYRLLTEAEFEYASRAGSSGATPWGSDASRACEFGNVLDQSAKKGPATGLEEVPCDDGYVTVAPVGQFAPNAFGLYDMTGNVWEWVQDCYIMPYPSAPVDGSAFERDGECDRRSVRGGGWRTRPDRQRFTFRGRDPAALRSNAFGFRVARDLE